VLCLFRSLHPTELRDFNLLNQLLGQAGA